jgi:hypothetical protein
MHYSFQGHRLVVSVGTQQEERSTVTSGFFRPGHLLICPAIHMHGPPDTGLGGEKSHFLSVQLLKKKGF